MTESALTEEELVASKDLLDQGQVDVLLGDRPTLQRFIVSLNDIKVSNPDMLCKKLAVQSAYQQALSETH